MTASACHGLTNIVQSFSRYVKTVIKNVLVSTVIDSLAFRNCLESSACFCMGRIYLVQGCHMFHIHQWYVLLSNHLCTPNNNTSACEKLKNMLLSGGIHSLPPMGGARSVVSPQKEIEERGKVSLKRRGEKRANGGCREYGISAGLASLLTLFHNKELIPLDIELSSKVFLICSISCVTELV